MLYVRTGHGKRSHKQSNVSSSDHDGLTPVRSLLHAGVLVLPGGPYSHTEDEQVEDDNRDQPFHMDGHLHCASEHLNDMEKT